VRVEQGKSIPSWLRSIFEINEEKSNELYHSIIQPNKQWLFLMGINV